MRERRRLRTELHIVFLAPCTGIGVRCVYSSTFTSYVLNEKGQTNCFLCLRQSIPVNSKTYLMAGVASWMYCVCSHGVVLWYICQLMLNLCTLVRVSISTPPDFWYLHMSLYAMSHLHFSCYHTFPDIGHCLHATLTCRDTCTAGVQLKLDLCHLHSPLYCPYSHLLCLHGHT